MGSLTKAQRAILAKDKDQLPVTALPGIGPRIGRYMKALGYARVGDLRGRTRRRCTPGTMCSGALRTISASCMYSAWRFTSRKTRSVTRSGCAGGTGGRRTRPGREGLPLRAAALEEAVRGLGGELLEVVYEMGLVEIAAVKGQGRQVRILSGKQRLQRALKAHDAAVLLTGW